MFMFWGMLNKRKKGHSVLQLYRWTDGIRIEMKEFKEIPHDGAIPVHDDPSSKQSRLLSPSIVYPTLHV